MRSEIKERIEKIKKGEVPEGYKEAKKAGVIPKDWVEEKFYKCVNIANGQVDPKIDPYCNMKHIGLGNIEKYTGRILYTKLAKEEDLTSGKYHFDKGTVLFGKIRPELGKVYYAEFEGICSADIYPLAPINGLNAQYLKYLIMDNRFYKYSVLVSMRTGMPKINREDIGGYSFIIPTIQEQQKIADILSAWDKAIELKEKLIVQKKEQKKVLMNKLLTCKTRLPGFDCEWKVVQLGKVLIERNETKFNNLELLAITSKNGVVRRSEVDIKDNSSEDKSKYKRICPLDIGYNTMRMWQGVSGVSEYEGIVSPAYTVLKPTEKVDSYFMGYLLKLPKIINLFWRNSQGLVEDTLNLKYSNLKKIKVRIPDDVNEQKAISEIFKTFDKNIELMQQELDALKLQKKGLMQLLLTGIVRVNN